MSTSSPKLTLDHSSESEQEAEPPSPDIKAFHGDAKPAAHHAEQVAHQNRPEHTGTESMEPSRHSTDSATAVPIGSVSQRRNRRPPLRANSTYVSRAGLQAHAPVKMVSHA